VDLSTADITAAEGFYRGLFDWTVATNQTPMGEYLIGSVGEREVGGMMAQSPETAGSPSVWTTFFFVDELDATLAAITSAGGSVLAPPFEIPDGARVSVVADPSGAMFALISEGPQPGPYFSMVVGAVSWVELMTRRPDEARAFYHQVFGWEAATEDAGGMPYTAFNLGDTQVGGMIETPAHLPDEVPDSWSVYFTVADCKATAEQATELGGEVILPPTQTPMGPFAVLADPQGAVFQVMEFAPEVSATN
jgi:predicted enzyme related to lactoylglutathione lyase